MAPFVPQIVYELALIRASNRTMQQSAEAFMAELRSEISDAARGPLSRD